MDKNIVNNILFKQWESTKKDSWINYWIWMYEIAKLVWQYDWEIEVYSKQWDKKLMWLYNADNLIKNNIEAIDKNLEFKTLWYDTYIKWETWTEFVFKIPVKNIQER